MRLVSIKLFLENTKPCSLAIKAASLQREGAIRIFSEAVGNNHQLGTEGDLTPWKEEHGGVYETPRRGLNVYCEIMQRSCQHISET